MSRDRLHFHIYIYWVVCFNKQSKGHIKHDTTIFYLSTSNLCCQGNYNYLK